MRNDPTVLYPSVWIRVVLAVTMCEVHTVATVGSVALDYDVGRILALGGFDGK